MTVSAILLAAGLSTRMGRPKPLLPWQDATLLEFQVAQLAAAGVGDIVVVLGHEADAVREHVRQPARAVLNPDYAEGRASSLRTGATTTPDDVEAIVILGVDQPRPAEIIARLLQEHRSRGNAITLPTHEAHRGHPIVLAGALLTELRQVQEQTLGLREVLEQYADAIVEVEFETPVVLLDLNTTADYERARALFGA